MAEDFAINQIEMELNRLRGKLDQSMEAKPADGSSFGTMLKEAISEVNELTNKADEAVKTQMVAGETTDLHSTMIALQKAEVSFQMMMQIRNKILKAYEDIMRTPI